MAPEKCASTGDADSKKSKKRTSLPEPDYSDDEKSCSYEFPIDRTFEVPNSEDHLNRLTDD
jgi:hypothetical protein